MQFQRKRSNPEAHRLGVQNCKINFFTALVLGKGLSAFFVSCCGMLGRLVAVIADACQKMASVCLDPDTSESNSEKEIVNYKSKVEDFQELMSPLFTKALN